MVLHLLDVSLVVLQEVHALLGRHQAFLLDDGLCVLRLFFFFNLRNLRLGLGSLQGADELLYECVVELGHLLT